MSEQYDMSQQWEALAGDVAMLAEIMERFMVGTLNNEREEAGNALLELQDFIESLETMLEEGDTP